VPSELLGRLQDCAQKLIEPPQQEIWKNFWKRVGLLAVDAAQDCLTGATVSSNNPVMVETELLLDLQECASKLAAPHGAEPAPEAIAVVAEFAQKTPELSNQYTRVSE